MSRADYPCIAVNSHYHLRRQSRRDGEPINRLINVFICSVVSLDGPLRKFRLKEVRLRCPSRFRLRRPNRSILPSLPLVARTPFSFREHRLDADSRLEEKLGRKELPERGSPHSSDGMVVVHRRGCFGSPLLDAPYPCLQCFPRLCW